MLRVAFLGRSGHAYVALRSMSTTEDAELVAYATIPPEEPPEEQVLVAGQNTAFNDEGNELRALIDGNVYLQGNTVHVEPVVTVDNINYETGNMDFLGSVVVRNEIADGFTVKAAGVIDVASCVGRARLSAGRQLLLRSGINAGGEGSIECEGNILARYVEGATIACRGDLLVEEAIMHSAIRVWGNVVFTGRRGELIGGTAMIGGSLWCKKPG